MTLVTPSCRIPSRPTCWAVAIVSAAIALGGFADRAEARMGTMDLAPAATLLVPYFEVDPDPSKPSVSTTLVVATRPMSFVCLAHVTLYTDRGLPTINFNLMLEDEESVEIDLHQLFTTGQLPFGAFGEDCEALSQTMPTTPADLVAAHTGVQSDGLFEGQCGGSPIEDGIARGFVTVDAVDDCTTLTPRDPDYFDGSIATEANVLIGHYTMRRTVPARATAMPMVHIEADSGSIGVESFYRRFGPEPSTDDGREPLPPIWMGPFVKDNSHIHCFHDVLSEEPFNCGGLLSVAVTPTSAFDHRGLPRPVGIASSPCGIAASSTPVGSGFALGAKTGTFVVDVDSAVVATTSGFTPRDQIFVSIVESLHPGGLSTHIPATALNDSILTGPVAEIEP